MPVSLIVVQHMPPGFTAPFAKRLDGLSRVKVGEAQPGQGAHAGDCLYRSRGPAHHRGARSFTHIDQPHRQSLHRPHKPSVDVAMLSVAEIFGSYALGIILTGMGSDGLQGMTAIHQAGGLTIGQDEASSVVYGMPRACAERGILDRVVPLQNVPGHILQAINYRPRI